MTRCRILRTAAIRGLALTAAVCAVLTASPERASACTAHPQGPVTPVPPPHPPCDICPCTASPWYVATGNYVTSVEDLRIPTSGFPLTVSRSYDSAGPMDGLLGVGWTLNLTARLYYASYLYSAPSTYTKEANVTMPDGKRWRFVENPDGTFAPPPTRHEALVRNPDGSFDLTPERSRSRYHFGSTGALETMTDEHGNALTATYDGNGRISRLSDSAGSGRYLDVFYGADGRVSTVQDSASRQVGYQYDSRGLLTTVTDPVGRTTTLSYVQTPSGYLLSGVTDHNGRGINTNAYGSTCLTSSYSDEGETYILTYGVGGLPNKVSKRDAADRTWEYTFNADGMITDRTALGSWDTPGGNFHTDYTANGQVEQTIDEVGVKTFYTYDVRGNVSSATRDYQGPTAVRFDYAYDASFPDNVTSIVPKNPSTGQQDFDWQAWRYDYYPTGSPSPGSLFHVYRGKSDAGEDTIATYTYDSAGRITQTVAAGGAATDYEYDGFGNLYRVTAPANNDSGTRPVTTYGYDGLGRVTSVTDALGHATTYTYDNRSRILTVTLPKPTAASPLNFTTTYSYDSFDAPTGLLFTSVTDPNGKMTRQGYDQYSRLGQVVDALNNVTTYTYANGLLSSMLDASNHVTSYLYDGRRRLRGVVHPNGATEGYQYHADGMLRVWLPRLFSFTYEYDHHKRLAQVIYPPNPPLPTIDYTYTGQKLTQVVDNRVTPAETHTMAYDTAYRLISSTQGSRGTVTYTHNPNDAVATMTVQGGPTSTYAFYPDGSLNTIDWTPVAGQFKYRYTLPGQYESVTFPNGQTRNFSYDDQGRVTQLSNLDPVAGNLATYGYGYDLNYTTGAWDRLGQRVSMTATVPAQGLNNHQTKYEYDNLYQLLKATYPNVSPFNGEVDSWTYDAIGNRLTNTVNSSTQTYVYGSAPNPSQDQYRLISDGVNSYSHDANGSVVSKSGPGGNFTFGWSNDNRLTGISGAASAGYGYDYQGRRSSKTVSGVTTAYLYDRLNLVSDGGASSADYLFGPGIDEPLAMSRGGLISYYVTDALGSVNVLANSSGGVQSSYLYDAWGQTRSQTGSIANPFTYTSREAGEGGSLFYRARYYTPSTGRFLAEDPKARRSGWSKYSYVRLDPATLRDPLGLYEVHGSCQRMACMSASGPFSDLMTQTTQETNERCTEPSLNQITDRRLRECMRRACEDGLIRCDEPSNCGGSGPNHAGYNYGTIGSGDINFTAFLCPRNFPPGIPVSEMGRLVVHEWAHGCGWDRADSQGPLADPYK